MNRGGYQLLIRSYINPFEAGDTSYVSYGIPVSIEKAIREIKSRRSIAENIV